MSAGTRMGMGSSGDTFAGLTGGSAEWLRRLRVAAGLLSLVFGCYLAWRVGYVEGLFLPAPASAAPVDCAKPSGHEEVRACAAAAKGVHELRQFIQRTRAIYILYIRDFERSVASVAAAEPDKADAPKLAAR